jgi:hypothetical protein
MSLQDYKNFIEDRVCLVGTMIEPEDVFHEIKPGACFGCEGSLFRVAMWQLISQGVISLTDDLKLCNVRS